MSYGLNSINTDGIVQIDQDYSNYVVENTGTITFSNSTSTQRAIPTVISNSNTLLFVRSNSTTAALVLGKAWPVTTDLISPWIFLVGNSGTFTVDWFTAVPASTKSLASSGYGLEIYRSNGSLAYSSNYNYQNVRTVINAGIFPNQTSAAATYNFSAMPNGQKPYFLMNNLVGPTGVVSVGISGSQFLVSWLYPRIIQPSNTSITINTGIGHQQTVPGAPQWQVAHPYIIVLAQLN